MGTKTYEVTLTGNTPLIMHQDSIEWSERVDRWLKIPENKKTSKAGDDRTPSWKWISGLYTDGNHVVVPSDNLMTCLREGGAKVTKSGKETFKRYASSLILVNEPSWDILVNGKPVPFTDDDELALVAEPDFAAHEEWAKARGFFLFAKRARIGQNKHIRVRPRFDEWTLRGTITVLDVEIIDDQVLEDIWRMAGSICGLCDWRPSSPQAPGSFGKFVAVVK